MPKTYWHQCPHCGHTEQHHKNLSKYAVCGQCEKLYSKDEIAITSEDRPEDVHDVQYKTSQDRAEETVFIDYCAFTYEVKGTNDPEVAISRAAQMLKSFLPHLEIEMRGKGFHGFYESAILLIDGVPSGLIASGSSTHRRTYVEMTGLACGFVNFKAFGQMLFDLKARLSRVDTALDFFNSKYDPQAIR
ncbi:MAG: hypothetical protein ABW066_11295, partial [Sedimenticola sp.]